MNSIVHIIGQITIHALNEWDVINYITIKAHLNLIGLG